MSIDEERLVEIETALDADQRENAAYPEARREWADECRELIAEVRRLRVLLETMDAHAAEAARALHDACNRNIVARRAERERCAKLADAYAKRAWASVGRAQEAAVAAEHVARDIRALPDSNDAEKEER